MAKETLTILCCYADGQLRDETKAALDEHAPGIVAYARIEADDAYGYGRILAALWANAAEEGTDLAVVEQDIVVRPDVIEAFKHCDCEYGAFPYSWGPEIGPALGCTRFRGTFIQRYPDAMKQAMAKRVTWRQLDVTLQRAILVRQYGEQPHICGPQVEHLNEAKQPRPDVRIVETLPAW